MAAIGPGEVARAGSGGTAACLLGPVGAYSSAGSNSQQPTGVRTQYSLFLRILSHLEQLALVKRLTQNGGIEPVLTSLLFCQADIAGRQNCVYLVKVEGFNNFYFDKFSYSEFTPIAVVH